MGSPFFLARDPTAAGSIATLIWSLRKVLMPGHSGGMEPVRTPLPHTPYDGDKSPFTVGLAPLDLKDWIEIDDQLGDYLEQKAELFRRDESAVFAAEPETRDAQAETLALLVEHLPRRFPDLYECASETISIKATGARYRIADHAAAPLKLAALLVQEDLVLMRKGPNGYRLAAAALAFPSSWSLEEKFSQDMTAIHENVPGFNGARMGAIVGRIFENLPVDAPVWRLNWSIYGDGKLHHPAAKSLEAQIGEGDPSFFVRVERQTLRRLPQSGDVLFTIRVHVDPFAAFARHPDGARLAAGLRAQLLALDADQLAYKGLTGERDRVIAALEAIAGAVRQAG